MGSSLLFDLGWMIPLVTMPDAEFELICRVQTAYLVLFAATRPKIGAVGFGKTLRNSFHLTGLKAYTGCEELLDTSARIS